MIVIDRPHTDYIYEFEVVVEWMTNENGEKVYEHRGFYENGFKAFADAEKIGGLVIHDVRTAGKKLK